MACQSFRCALQNSAMVLAEVTMDMVSSGTTASVTGGNPSARFTAAERDI